MIDVDAPELVENFLPRREAPFRARLKAISEDEDSGKWRYSFVELASDPNEVGGYIEVHGRNGDADSSPAYEINNLEIDVTDEPIVLMQFRGAEGDIATYEFDGSGHTGSGMEMVYITDVTVDADGNYPARLTTFNPLTSTWSNALATIKVRASNNEKIVQYHRFLARYAGVNDDGVSVYTTDLTSGITLSAESISNKYTLETGQYTTIWFNPTSGVQAYRTDNPATPERRSARVELLPASLSQAGAVITSLEGVQNFSGIKGFANKIRATITSPAGIEFVDDLSTGSRGGIFVGNPIGGADWDSHQITISRDDDAGPPNIVGVSLSPTVNIVTFVTSGDDYPSLRLYKKGGGYTYKTGSTGTLADGTEVTSGLITGLGGGGGSSGSFLSSLRSTFSFMGS